MDIRVLCSEFLFSVLCCIGGGASVGHGSCLERPVPLQPSHHGTEQHQCNYTQGVCINIELPPLTCVDGQKTPGV